jgi:hypothetical protein
VDNPQLDIRTNVSYNDYGLKGLHPCPATSFSAVILRLGITRLNFLLGVGSKVRTELTAGRFGYFDCIFTIHVSHTWKGGIEPQLNTYLNKGRKYYDRSIEYDRKCSNLPPPGGVELQGTAE